MNDVYGHLRSEFNNRAFTGAAKEPQTPATANYASATSGKKSKKPFKGKGASMSTPTTTNSSSTDGCGYCHHAGHDRDNCHALKMKLFYELHNPPLNSKKPPPSKGMTFSSGNIATYESGYSTLSPEPIPSAMVSDPPSDIWVVDSGCSHHMVPLAEICFTEYSIDVPGSRTITGVTGNAAISGMGNLSLTSPNGGRLNLTEVLRAPELPYSLLSLGRLLMDDVKITFLKPYCILENSDGFYLKVKFEQSFGATSFLFRFKANFPAAAESNSATTTAISEITEDQISLWHARVGHSAVSTLPQIGKVAIVPESFRTAISGAFPSPGVCEPCLEGKQTRLPYRTTEQKPTDPLQVIHTDTCYIPAVSIKGYKDFITFTDQVTHMSFIYYLLDKKPSTVLRVFEEFKERVELHFSSQGYKIKAVRMDGGSEYMSTLRGSNSYQATLQNYLQGKGINCEVSTRYSPESNGISERLN